MGETSPKNDAPAEPECHDDAAKSPTKTKSEAPEKSNKAPKKAPTKSPSKTDAKSDTKSESKSESKSTDGPESRPVAKSAKRKSKDQESSDRSVGRKSPNEKAAPPDSAKVSSTEGLQASSTEPRPPSPPQDTVPADLGPMAAAGVLAVVVVLLLLRFRKGGSGRDGRPTEDLNLPLDESPSDVNQSLNALPAPCQPLCSKYDTQCLLCLELNALRHEECKKACKNSKVLCSYCSEEQLSDNCHELCESASPLCAMLCEEGYVADFNIADTPDDRRLSICNALCIPYREKEIDNNATIAIRKCAMLKVPECRYLSSIKNISLKHNTSKFDTPSLAVDKCIELCSQDVIFCVMQCIENPTKEIIVEVPSDVASKACVLLCVQLCPALPLTACIEICVTTKFHQRMRQGMDLNQLCVQLTKEANISPYDFGEVGYQCTANYINGSFRILQVGFCKVSHSFPRSWFKWSIGFGKYFFGTDSCFEIWGSQEVRINIGFPQSIFSRIQFLELSPGHFRFMNATLFTEEDCSAVPFRAFSPVDVYDETLFLMDEVDFLIGRAIQWSSKCQDMDIIPALYSRKRNLCVLGVRPYQSLKLLPASSCQVLCDSSGTAKDGSFLYSSN